MDFYQSFGGDAGFGSVESWDTAAQFGTGSTLDEPAYADTVTADAIRGSGPTVPVSSVGNEWGGFFKDTAKALVSYGIAKDAQQNGIRAAGYPVTQYATQPAQAPLISGQMLLLVAVAGVVFLIAKG